jgi:hypothetical protein
MKPLMKMFSLVISLLLVLSTLSACQRESYQPTAIPGTAGTALSTQLSASTVTPGLATETNAVTQQPDWETQYTEANPVTDSEELIAILQDFYDRFMAQFNQPGWYRFYAGEVGERVTWVHISAPETRQFDGLLELYDYPELYAPGFIWPTAVVGPEGQVGFTQKTEAMDDYYFLDKDSSSNFLADHEPTLNNIGYFIGDVEGVGQFGHLHLLRTIQSIENPVHDHRGAYSESNFTGWIGTYENQSVFVLKTVTVYSGVLPMMESGERLVRDESNTYFDLRNGGAIVNISDNYYQSGKIDFGEENQPTLYNYNLVEWFEILPEYEQNIYDEALQRLEAFNQGGSPDR